MTASQNSWSAKLVMIVGAAASSRSEAGAKTIADMPNYKAGSRVSVVSEVQ